MKVCKRCLMAIESHEGHQSIIKIWCDLDIDEEETLICEWCEEEDIELYEI